jgi:hypothetical protein
VDFNCFCNPPGTLTQTPPVKPHSVQRYKRGYVPAQGPWYRVLGARASQCCEGLLFTQRTHPTPPPTPQVTYIYLHPPLHHPDERLFSSSRKQRYN